MARSFVLLPSEPSEPLGDEAGALGLPYGVAGAALQGLTASIVDRGDATREEVVDRLVSFDEDAWWDAVGGPLVDELFADLFPERQA